MKLSARNQLKGKVININKGAVNSIVSIDIGGGNIITATISCAAVEELGLKVGSDAYAVIKATNVMFATKRSQTFPLAIRSRALLLP